MGSSWLRQPHFCPVTEREKPSGPGAAGHQIPSESPNRKLLLAVPILPGSTGDRVSWGSVSGAIAMLWPLKAHEVDLNGDPSMAAGLEFRALSRAGV